jgi:methyl-accepting chemotaxis protein
MNFRPLFYPGIWVMRQMHFATKLTLMALALLTPLVVVLVQLVTAQISDMQVTRDEIQGIALISDANALIHQLQSDQVLVARTLLPALEKLDTRLAAVDDAKLNNEWRSLRARIAAPSVPLGRLRDALIEDLGRFAYGSAKQSSLLFDPDPATYLLIDMAVSRTIPWVAQTGQLQAQLAELLLQPTRTAAIDARVASQLQALDVLVRDTQYSMALMKELVPVNPLAEQAVQSTQDYARQVRARMASDSASAEMAALAGMGAQARAHVVDYQRSVLRQSAALLQHRHDATHAMLWLTSVGSVACVLVMLYFLLAFHVGFSVDLRRMLRTMQLTASGDLCQRVILPGKDELAEMSTAIDAMTTHFSAMVASVRSNSALVLHAGASLSQASRALSERTEKQAANLEQTAASVQQLSATVKDNANAAQRSAVMAGGVRDVAETGAQAMADAIETVETIQGSTRRMDEIVGVIDGLAFQTNILALNAAVEAARAGESGRGFAVVASEVRSLAQRSADSAKEIRLLISTSSDQVDTGVAQIRKAGDKLTQVVDGIRGVASSMTQISISSAEQSTGLSEITAAVHQLDEITQQNAALAERAVNQADDLELRATTLSEAVSAFKLQQGTAEEAFALVARAVAYRRQCGSRESYLRDLTLADKGFFDRDMYIFALDRHGQYLSFGGNPAKVGTRVQDIVGIDGAGLMNAILSQADHEPGWVSYDITNPSSGRVQTKISFVQQLDDLIVGCGVYKNLVLN